MSPLRQRRGSTLASRTDAVEFLRDHRGRRILRFKEVNRELPGKLDAGRFD